MTYTKRQDTCIDSKEKPKSKPKAELSTSTSTKTSADTEAESHLGMKRADDISADTDTDQTMGDGPTTKQKDASQPRPSTDDRLEHGRQMPNPKERQECATPQ